MLAPTAFTTGVDESLATVDAYGLDTATATLDTAANSSDEFDANSLQGLLGGNQGDPTSMIAGLDESQGLIMDADALKSNMVSSIPGAGDMLSNLGPGMSGAVLSSGGAMTQITATVGGVTAMISKANLSSLTGVASLIGAVSGAPFPISLKDNAGLAALGTNLLKQAATLGIPGAYTQMAAGLSGNPGMLTQVTQGILPTVASTSNVNMLAEIASGPLGSSIGSLSPGFTASFLGSFKLPAGSTTASMVPLGNKLHSSLNTIQPGWNKTTPASTRPTYPNRPSTARPLKNSSTLVLRGSVDYRQLVSTCANAKVQPVVTKPTVRRTQPAALVPNPNTEFPTGTTSVSQSNSDGSSTTTYTLPDTTVVTRVTSADKSSVSSTYAYPVQPQAAPTPTDLDGYIANTAPVTYDSTAENYENLAALDNAQALDPTAFGEASFGVGATAAAGTQSDGSEVTMVQAANGSYYTQTTHPDGTIEYASMESADPDDYTGSDDPYANWAANTAANDTAMSAAMCDFYDQGQAEALATGTPSYMTMDASDALQAGFPQTYVGDPSANAFFA